jgi:hypothetical protein
MAYRVLIAQFKHETNTFSKLPTTLNDYRKRFLVEGEAMVPKSIQEGRLRALLWWETRAIEMAGGAPGNSQIVIIALKSRSRAASGWHHDSVKLEHTGPEGEPPPAEPRKVLDISTLSWEQRDQLKAILLTVKAAHGDKANSKK